MPSEVKRTFSRAAKHWRFGLRLPDGYVHERTSVHLWERNLTRIWHGVAIGLVGLFACLTSPASAETLKHPADCTAAIREKPTLDVKRLPSARFRMVTDTIGWERNKSGKQLELTLNHGEETADLKDGVTLRIAQGGCETYSNRYEFSFSRPPPGNANGAYWLRKAGELLLEIAPANVDKIFPLQNLANALIRQAQNHNVTRAFLEKGLEGKLESGPPSYLVEVERLTSKTVLRVSYFIPL